MAWEPGQSAIRPSWVLHRAALHPVVIIAATSLLLAACARPGKTAEPGSPDQPASSPTGGVGGANLVPPGYAGRFRVLATVLESPDHGPQLCAGVALSLPPQCGGLDVVGWDWDTVDHETANGTTWGDYLVTGEWDEATTTFTLTEPATGIDEAPESERAIAPTPDFRSPCPTPEGGWRPLDMNIATNEAMDRAISAARAEPDFAGAWLDQSYLREPGANESDANDPKRLVLNLRFAGDLDRHDEQIRAIWGGALCLSRAARPLSELEGIRSEVTAELGQLSSSLDEVAGIVQVTVTVATESAQAKLDERYGPGVVLLNGWLRPID